MKLRAWAVALTAMGCSTAAFPGAAAVPDDVIRIGFITDLSGLYSDLDGAAGAEAIRMAIEDFGGQVNGKPIEFLLADHQNKADIASSQARSWFDQQKIDVLIGGTNSSAALAMSGVAHEKKKPYIVIGAASSALTNEQCTPYTIHYAYNTNAMAQGTGKAVVNAGGDTWFFLTADYAYGHALERETAGVAKASGGKIVGTVRAPLNTADYSSYMLQAQASGAKILGLANAGGDFVNAVRAASEFGITRSMNLAGLQVTLNDIHALGLETTQGMYFTTPWYWAQDDEAKAWSERFHKRVGRMPSFIQAGDYSAVTSYLNAVKATGTDDAEAVMNWLKSNKINDMFVKDGYVRRDGRMIRDMHLAQVKAPSESKQEWDYYHLVSRLSGEEVFAPEDSAKCKFIAN